MYDEFGNYIGGGKSGFYSPQNISGMISSPNDGGFNTNYGKSYSQQAPPPLTAQQLAATGFNPNYGQSYSQPNPAGSLAPIQQMKSIPLSQMDLSNGTLAPGVLSGGVSNEKPGLVNTAASTVSKVAGLASKANPYLAAGSLALGGLQTIVGAIGLARSKRPEGYKETPEMAKAIGEAEQAAQYGLGAQQIALANQQAREAQNTQLFNARSMAGGNLSRSIFGANTYNRLMAGNQLAAQDFAAQQQKVGIRNQLYGTRQRLADANTQLAQQNYAREQEAYGGAMRSGLTNLGSFFNLNQALNYNPAA
jgi:hypothetical protein